MKMEELVVNTLIELAPSAAVPRTTAEYVCQVKLGRPGCPSESPSCSGGACPAQYGLPPRRVKKHISSHGQGRNVVDPCIEVRLTKLETSSFFTTYQA